MNTIAFARSQSLGEELLVAQFITPGKPAELLQLWTFRRNSDEWLTKQLQELKDNPPTGEFVMPVDVIEKTLRAENEMYERRRRWHTNGFSFCGKTFPLGKLNFELGKEQKEGVNVYFGLVGDTKPPLPCSWLIPAEFQVEVTPEEAEQIQGELRSGDWDMFDDESWMK